MPIAALVVTLDPEPEQRLQALLALKCDAQFTLGTPHGSRLPVVVEGTDDRDTLVAIQRAERTAGVMLVEVVSVDFSDLESTNARPTDGRRRRTEQ